MKWGLLLFAALLPSFVLAAEWEQIGTAGANTKMYVDKTSLVTKNLLGDDGQYHQVIIGWVKYVHAKPIKNEVEEMEYTGISCDLNTVVVYSDWQYGSYNSVIASSHIPIQYAPDDPIVPDSIAVIIHAYFCRSPQ